MDTNDHRLDRALINELAEVVGDPAMADMITSRAGFPRRLTPPPSRPLAYWELVVRDARNGAMNDGVRALAKEAARQFPANPIFRAIENKDEETTWSVNETLVDARTPIEHTLRSVTGDSSLQATSLAFQLELQATGRTILVLEHQRRNGELARTFLGLPSATPTGTSGYKFLFVISSTIAFASLLCVLGLFWERQTTPAVSVIDAGSTSSGMPDTSTSSHFEPSSFPPKHTSGTTLEIETKAGDTEMDTKGNLEILPKSRLVSCPAKAKLKMNIDHSAGKHTALVRIEPLDARLKYGVRIVTPNGQIITKDIHNGQGSIQLGNAASTGEFKLIGTTTGKCEMYESEPARIEFSRSN